jgi:hypothetical protein
MSLPRVRARAGVLCVLPGGFMERGHMSQVSQDNVSGLWFRLAE